MARWRLCRIVLPTFDCLGETNEVVAERSSAFWVQSEPTGHAVWDVASALSHGGPLFGQCDEHAPIVGGISAPFHHAEMHESLDQRSEGTAVEAQAGPELTHRERAIALPEYEHGDILRIGQAELVEVRSVGAPTPRPERSNSCSAFG